MSTQTRYEDTARALEALFPEHNGEVAVGSSADAPGKPAANLGSVVTQLVELVDELANERGQQLELTQTLLTTIRTLLEEQAELQRDVAELRRRVGASAAEPRALKPADALAGASGDEHRALCERTHQARRDSHELTERAHALCEQTHQARRDSHELIERAHALCERASVLIAEWRRLSAHAPRASPAQRTRP